MEITEKRPGDQENIRHSTSHMTKGRPFPVDSNALVLAMLIFLCLECSCHKRNRKGHFQSINWKAIANVSQLHLLVPIWGIPASREFGNVSQNSHIPQPTKLDLAGRYC